MTRLAKRYVLFEADTDLSEEEKKEFGRILEKRYGKMPLIDVRGNEKALIIKANNAVAAAIKEQSSEILIGGKKLTTKLVSGAIGNLKRRAGESQTR